MNSLVAIGTLAAFKHSAVATLRPGLLPVAAGALSGFGIALPPVPAAVVMAPSGVFVLSIARRLRRFRPLQRAIP